MVKILLIVIIILGGYIYYNDTKPPRIVTNIVQAELKTVKEKDETKRNMHNGTHTSKF